MTNVSPEGEVPTNLDTQEALAEPNGPIIPLEYRLAHLAIDPQDIFPMLNASALTKQLDMHSRQVDRDINKFNIPRTILHDDALNQTIPHYPHYAVELIREERAWKQWWMTLPAKMNTTEVAEAIGRSHAWTAGRLQEMYPEPSTIKHPMIKGARINIYSRMAVQRLRNETLATPPDDGWYTIPRLMELTGKKRDWITVRLKREGIRPENRRQALTGRDFPHYPPDTLDALLAYPLHVPAGGAWLTARAITERVDRSKNWVQLRLKQYIGMSEIRLDDREAERIHYPPEVVEYLQKESAEQASVKPAGEWSNMSMLERDLGRHAATLLKLMETIEVKSKKRLDALGREQTYYSPKTKRRLAAKALESLAYPEADGWYTFNQAVQYIGRTPPWVREQLVAFEAKVETRLDRNRQPNDHYHPLSVKKIKELGDKLDAGNMYSIADLTKALGKSRLWVTARLEPLLCIPKKRFSRSSGRLIDHYPNQVRAILAAQLPPVQPDPS